MQKNFFVWMLVAFTVMGCGFHLRGTYPGNAYIQYLGPVYLQADTNYDEFMQILQQNLRANKVAFATSPQKAHLILRILSTGYNQRLQQLSANTQVKVYWLTYTINYQLDDAKGNTRYGPTALTTSMAFSTSDTQLLADANVLRMQKRQLMRDIVNALLHVLSSQNVRTKLVNV